MDADDVLSVGWVLLWLGLFVAIPVTTLTRPTRRTALLALLRRSPWRFAWTTLLSVGIWLALVTALGWMVLGTVYGGTRSSAERAAFLRQNPCPSTDQRRGACPGYVIDHVIPLACDGPDHRSNMQWQTTAEAREKDRWERRACHSRRNR